MKNALTGESKLQCFCRQNLLLHQLSPHFRFANLLMLKPLASILPAVVYPKPHGWVRSDLSFQYLY